MNANKDLVTFIAEIAQILSVIALFLAFYQLYESKYLQLENNIDTEVGYTMNLILPCWKEWKGIYYDSQELKAYDRDFLEKVSIAEDRWNETLIALNIEGHAISESAYIDQLLRQGEYKKIKDKIRNILSENIDSVLTDFHRSIQQKRIQLSKRKI